MDEETPTKEPEKPVNPPEEKPKTRQKKIKPEVRMAIILAIITGELGLVAALGSWFAWLIIHLVIGASLMFLFLIRAARGKRREASGNPRGRSPRLPRIGNSLGRGAPSAGRALGAGRRSGFGLGGTRGASGGASSRRGNPLGGIFGNKSRGSRPTNASTGRKSRSLGGGAPATGGVSLKPGRAAGGVSLRKRPQPGRPVVAPGNSSKPVRPEKVGRPSTSDNGTKPTERPQGGEAEGKSTEKRNPEQGKADTNQTTIAARKETPTMSNFKVNTEAGLREWATACKGAPDVIGDLISRYSKLEEETELVRDSLRQLATVGDDDQIRNVRPMVDELSAMATALTRLPEISRALRVVEGQSQELWSTYLRVCSEDEARFDGSRGDDRQERNADYGTNTD